jgi:hypothetical protein
MRVQALNKVRDFANWLVDASRNEHGHATLNIVISDRDIATVNDDADLTSISNSGDVAARPMPTRYHLELKKIIAEDDFAWPKSLRNMSTKLPLHWFQWQNPNGSAELIFCEVLPRMLLLHLDLPLRNIQVRRLDSGEGDRARWDPERRIWIPNCGPNVGYWENAGARNPRRGVFREISGREGSIAGFWINSNKTADAKTRFDEHSGYQIPWQHDEVLGNLTEMRNWQERYNPVDGPLAFTAVPKGIFADDPSKSVKAQIPARFYLFRYPQNGGERGKEAPPTYKVFLQFFYDALDELERRLNAEDPENPVTIITKRDPTGAPKQAIFTLHGMRSSTLTALYEEGVSIEILSKLVAGHASILMTLKYLKFEPAHVSQILTEARMKALTKARSDFPNFLRNATFEQAARMTARLSDDGLYQIFGSFSNSSAWARLDRGICPNGATLCGIGGKLFRRKSDNGRDKSTYSPVPGGPRNCVRCRFFITGSPFLIPLAIHAHEHAEKADRLARRISSGEQEIENLKQQRRKLSSEGQPISPELRERIIMKEEAWLSDIESRDCVLADFQATALFVDKIRAIRAEDVANGYDEKLQMVLAGEEFPELVGRESTRFAVVDAVVQASRWLPSINADELERERDADLDKMLHRNRYTPITLAPLTVDERRHGADAMAAYLLIELGAFETQALIDGRKTLEEVGIERPLKEIYRRSIGLPLARSSLPRLSRTSPGRDALGNRSTE